MGVNHVMKGTRTVLDLRGDTVTAATLQSGATAHDKAGNAITGSLVIQKYYTGAGEPSSSLGANGDLYLKVV